MTEKIQQWYIAQFKPNAHKMAMRNLHRQGFTAFLPRIKSTKRKDNHYQKQIRPLFPGYLFVSFDEGADPWRKINNTLGVMRLVGIGSKPSQISEEFITALKARCDKTGLLIQGDSMSEGDRVMVLSGPFSEFIATIETIEADRRVWLLLDIMGQTTRLAVTPEDLRKIC